MPEVDPTQIYAAALKDIREILDSTHKDALPGEKLVRIGWVIGNLPKELRDVIVNEAQNRVMLAWSWGSDHPVKPTEW
jgi:hypothetical protein